MKSILPHAALDARKSLDTKCCISFSFTKFCVYKSRGRVLGHLFLTWLCFYYWQMLRETDVAQMSEAASDLGHNNCLKCDRKTQRRFWCFSSEAAFRQAVLGLTLQHHSTINFSHICVDQLFANSVWTEEISCRFSNCLYPRKKLFPTCGQDKRPTGEVFCSGQTNIKLSGLNDKNVCVWKS